MRIEIKDIGNLYGGLSIMKNKNKYYWIIESCYKTNFKNIQEWEEIPKALFYELLKQKA